MLTLLAAELGTAVNDDVVTAATGVELTHLASLYHDDVMDEADLRRGVVSANARYGNSDAILVGDLLFGKASELVAELGPEAVKIQAQTFVRLCSGQIRDARPAPEGVDPIEYYLGVLADKTGVVIATAARYGAMVSGCPADDRLKELIGPGCDLRNDALHAEALGLLQAHPAMGQARERTDSVARETQELLAPLAIGLPAGAPAADAIAALSALVESVVN